MDITLIFSHRFYRAQDRIVFSIQNYNYPLFLKRYLQVFDNIRILSRVFDNPSVARKGRFTEGKGVEVISLGTWGGFSGVFFNWASIKNDIHRLIPPDSAVIVVVPSILGSIVYKIFRGSSRPYGLEVVGDPYDVFSPGSVKHPLRPFFRWWFSRSLRRQCATASAVAYVTEKALQRRYPTAPDAFTTHYSSIQLSEEAVVSSPRKEKNYSGRFVLVFVGTLAQLYKAPDLLIDAIAKCLLNGLDIKLNLIGSGKYEAELKARASKLGISERVRFMGQLPSGKAVRDKLDRADLFVLPSITEGLPRAMIEAMARGLPCIGSDVGGIPELLVPEDMVPAGDVGALAGKIHEVLADPERMAAMSARNLEKARKFSDNVLRERRIAFYRYLRDKTASWLKSKKR